MGRSGAAPLQMLSWRCVLNFRVYADWNYWTATGWEDHIVPDPHESHVEGKAGAQGTHVGVAKVPEPRLLELAKLYNPKKITYATVQYVDLGGMQKERNRDASGSFARGGYDRARDSGF